MNVVLVNGSPREKGCTFTGLGIIKEQLALNGVDSAIFQVGNKPIRGCIACMSCKNTCPPRRGGPPTTGGIFPAGGERPPCCGK